MSLHYVGSPAAPPVKQAPFRDGLDVWFSSVFDGGLDPTPDALTKLLLGYVVEQADQLDAMASVVAAQGRQIVELSRPVPPVRSRSMARKAAGR